MTKSIDTFIKEHNKAKEIFVEHMSSKGQELLSEKFVKFMADNLGVKSVSWAGYTPYFNDGDASCDYGINEPNFKLTPEFMATLVGQSYKKTDYDGTPIIKQSKGHRTWEYKEYPVVEVPLEDIDAVEEYLYDDGGLIQNILSEDHPLVTAMNELSKFITEELGEACLLMFGDHVKVTYERDSDSFQVDEYSHD